MPESSHGAPLATPTTFGSRRSYCTNVRKPRARLLSSLCGSLPLRYRPGTSLRRSGTQPMAGTWLLQPSAQPPSCSTQVIATKHQGIFPKDFASIRALPGGGALRLQLSALSTGSPTKYITLPSTPPNSSPTPWGAPRVNRSELGDYALPTPLVRFLEQLHWRSLSAPQTHPLGEVPFTPGFPPIHPPSVAMHAFGAFSLSLTMV